VTDDVKAIVAESGIGDGLVNVQTRHTTTAVIVNEDEPSLLEDMKLMLARMAPEPEYYQHNDFEIRTANMTPEERPNGHSHCRSLLLGTSATLNVLDGEIQRGRWQRIFFVELDHERARTVSVMAMGLAAAD
jgi:secondary thiamine-phosphate synthase enzyme